MSPDKYEWRGKCILNVDDKVFYQTVESMRDGQIFQIGDCVSLLPEEGKLTYIGRIVALYEQLEAKIIQTCWFYRPEETMYGRQPGDGDKELFFSDEKAENSITSVCGICFVVTLSQFRKGVRYLQQVNPIIDESNLFFAQKKYDRVAHSCQYLPMYKALGNPISNHQPGWDVERVLATMRCKTTDQELIFVKWKNRNPIYNSWIVKENDSYLTNESPNISNLPPFPGNLDPLENIKLQKIDMTDHDDNKNNINNNNNSDTYTNGIHHENTAIVNNEIEKPPTNGLIKNNSNNMINMSNIFELKNTIINISSSSIPNKQFGFGSANINNSNLTKSPINQTLDSAFNIPAPMPFTQTLSLKTPSSPTLSSSSILTLNPSPTSSLHYQQSPIESSPPNSSVAGLNLTNNKQQENNVLKLPITIKITQNKTSRVNKSSPNTNQTSKKTSTSSTPSSSNRAHDKWDISNVVSTSGNVSYIPQQRPFDDVNIPQWHVMTKEEEYFIPEDEGSSDEDTDDEAYDILHHQASLQLKSQIAELHRLEQEKSRFKKTIKVEHYRSDDEEDDALIDD